MYEVNEQWNPIFDQSVSFNQSFLSSEHVPSSKKKTKRKKSKPIHSVAIEEVDEYIQEMSKDMALYSPSYTISFSSEGEDEDDQMKDLNDPYSNKSNTVFIEELGSEEDSFSDQYEESVLAFDMERFSDINFNIPENDTCETCGYDIFQICTTNIDVFNKFVKSDTLYQRFLFNFVKNVLKALGEYSNRF